MEILLLKANKRGGKGKELNKKLRSKGSIPAVIYGEGKDNLLAEVDYKELYQILHIQKGGNVILSLKMEDSGEEENVVLREVQRHPVSHKLLHADFHRISLNKKSHFFVQVQSVGSAEGVKAGGIIEHHTREIEIKCLPLELPKSFDVDITHLKIGDSIHVKEVTVPPGIEIISSPDTVLFSIIAPKAVEVPVVAAEEEAAAEPELITSKKKEEAEE